MAKKKNKKSKKPAVGKPAAGSNNKRDNNQSQNAKTSEKNWQNKSDKSHIHNESGKKDSALKKGDSKVEVKSIEKSVKKSEEVSNDSLLESKKSKFLDKVKKIESDKENKRTLSKKEKKDKKFEFDFKKIIEFIKKKIGVKKLLIFAGIVAAIAVAFVFMLNINITVPDNVKNAEFKGRIENESVAFTMDISESQQEALSKATKVKGEKDAFSFFINDKIIMNEYDDPALIEFGSVKSNNCVLVFFILDENGKELYRSRGIEPGRQISSIEFFDQIPYGTNEVTVAVLGYDAETYEKTGMQTTKITLEIGVE